MVAYSTPKQRLLSAFARIGKAVSSPRRLDLLDLLSQAEKTVEELAEAAGISVKNTSAHLRTLREARLVETRQEGTYVHYRLASEEVRRFLRQLQDLARLRLPEVELVIRDFYEDPDGLEPLSAGELMERVEKGEVTVVDVRPLDEYEAGHIAGARSIPLADLKDRIGELAPGREIVAYCRGPYCMLSIEAVQVLREHGFGARLMKEGVAAWRREGGAVSVGIEE